MNYTITRGGRERLEEEEKQPGFKFGCCFVYNKIIETDSLNKFIATQYFNYDIIIQFLNDKPG